MKQIKLIHCADLHLDMPFTSLGSYGDKPSQRRRELLAVFDSIVEETVKRKADFLVICGDLYEHGYARKSVIAYINEKLGGISPIDAVILPGNHDPLVSNSFYGNFKWNENIHIIKPGCSKIIEKSGIKVHFTGLKYEDNKVVIDRDIDPGNVNIVMFHGTVDMPAAAVKYDIPGDVLKSIPADYVALGHSHKVCKSFNGNDRLFNPGSPEPLGFDEEGDHGVFEAVIYKKERDSRLETFFIKTARRFYKNLDLDITGCGNDLQVIDRMASTLENIDSSNGLFNIVLKGYIDTGYKPDLDFIYENIEDKAFFIKINNSSLPGYDLGKICRDPGIKGLFTRRMMERIEEESSDHKKQLMLNAIYYGLESLETGKPELSFPKNFNID